MPDAFTYHPVFTVIFSLFLSTCPKCGIHYETSRMVRGAEMVGADDADLSLQLKGQWAPTSEHGACRDVGLILVLTRGLMLLFINNIIEWFLLHQNHIYFKTLQCFAHVEKSKTIISTLFQHRVL